ncbi:hypothetical protein [Adhaeribacter rhizoryzae]|uniref:Glycosyltransferase RgtA/B/C/D-like domain-containing protein n=1 Tax=Adhaeribacter rhizoryzae TaxID=2607907 RepID=A0A5M6DQ50_9BACT|nr:hypothetical protein [Adhaeribacter rhizoryzae]KAA5548310.1 hypothetical protein F0145_06170 [Adhaeribacter rhizoryzae]
MPALTVKLVGAIALGIIFQFYYGRGSMPSGDTGNYYKQSRIVMQAFYDSPATGIKLLLSKGEYNSSTVRYASRMYWYTSSTEFFVIKVASFFGIIGLGSYAVIALFFAFTSFSGMWSMYLTFLKLYPNLHKQLAIAIFFLPSVFFWGSGLMKDSITIGALGWLFYGFHTFAIEKKSLLKAAFIIFISAYVLYTVKVYILLAFLPPALFWIFIENNRKIRNTLLRNLAKPFFILIGLGVAYLGATNLTEGDSKYDIDNIGERTKINAIYLTEQVATGSAYNIGIFDGSLSSMITVGPQAIVVALYRPFLWEVRNPVMLLSAIEATIFIYLTLTLFYKTGFFKSIKLITSTPILLFSILFSIVLAFAVGTNSGNFGTLVRYKIPLMPFYLSALYIMRYHYLVKRPKKLVRLATTA